MSLLWIYIVYSSGSCIFNIRTDYFYLQALFFEFKQILVIFYFFEELIWFLSNTLKEFIINISQRI